MAISALFLILLGFAFFALVVGVVAALFSKSKVGGFAALAGLALLTLILAFVLLSVMSIGRPSVQQASVSTASAPSGETASVIPTASVKELEAEIAESIVPPVAVQPPIEVGSTITGNPAWTDADEYVFAITHFPSIESAVGPLISETVKRFNERGFSLRNVSNKLEAARVYVWVSGEAEAVKDRVVESVQDGFSEGDVRIATGVQLDAITLQISVRETFIHNAEWDTASQVRQGMVFCKVHTAEGEAFTVTKHFDEKPWVDAFDRFVSTYPRRRFVVGYSSSVQSSETEARKSAMSDLRRKAEIDYGNLSYNLAREPYVVDRFAQKLERPYGAVWREAVLLEVTHRALQDARDARPSLMVRRESGPRGMWLVVSLALIASLAVTLCVLLNWITEGYYQGRLVMACGLLGVLVCSTMLLVS